MSSSQQELVVVFGATGVQGASVVDAVLEKTDFKVRAITRDTSSAKAKALAAKSDRIEVVAADSNKEETLAAAFKDATKAFLVTAFWDPASMRKELEQGKRLGDAAKAAGVKQIVISSLANVREESNGKWDVPHFTDKADAAAYLSTLGFESVAEFAPAFYYQNILPGSMLGPKDETFTLPDLGDQPIAMIDATQSGDVVVAAFKDPATYNGKFLASHGDLLTSQQAVDIFREVHGIDYKVNLLKPEEWPFKELGQMFGWFGEFSYFGKDKANSISGNVAAGGSLRTLKAFLLAQPKAVEA